jgi:hypothetical protein
LVEKDFGLHFVILQDGVESHNQLESQDSAHHQDGAEKNGQKDGENTLMLL